MDITSIIVNEAHLLEYSYGAGTSLGGAGRARS
jgi:hypothetical protein